MANMVTGCLSTTTLTMNSINYADFQIGTSKEAKKHVILVKQFFGFWVTLLVQQKWGKGGKNA